MLVSMSFLFYAVKSTPKRMSAINCRRHLKINRKIYMTCYFVPYDVSLGQGVPLRYIHCQRGGGGGGGVLKCKDK
jgi:hypothetical protein